MKKGNIMKKVLSLLLVMLILASTLALVSCGGNKQVPVYQGMTIGSATKALYADNHHSGFELFANTNNGNGNDGDNGNHYGNGNQKPGDVDGDHDGRNDKPDKENPYPDNSTNENIENEIKSSLKVVGSVYDIYYASANEDIYIYIHIDNPDNYEIMSFTLNGKKYSSYMFEQGSDMETIILKYNVGANSGIVTYTIDAIKYIDGTEIKDVIIDGDKTVMAGIRSENQVVANVSNLDIGTNSFGFDVYIADNDGLAEFCGGAFKAVLYDGDEIVQEIDLVKGENSIKFENLKTHALYQYAIVGYYDNLTGSGFGMNVLYKDALYTESVVLFDNIVIGQDKIDFTFLWNEEATSDKIESLKLYKDGVLVKELSPSATSVADLLSNNTYVLVAEYLNAGQTESIYIEFTTFAKGVPGFSLNKTDSTQTSISFEIIEFDEENVGSITKIELLLNDSTTVADSLGVREFTDLLSDNTYVVRVTYVYDLNDGSGAQTIVKELEISTLAKAAPTISIINSSSTQDSVSFEFAETDEDNVGSISKVELVDVDGNVIANDVNAREFNKLLSYHAYTVKVTYVYDLNDGNGEQTIVERMVIKTLPAIDVETLNVINTSVVSEGETIYIQVTLSNPANVAVQTVVVNGNTYHPTPSSTPTRLFLEIVNNGQFESGENTLSLESINIDFEGKTVSIKPNTIVFDSVTIYGTPSVVKIEYVNQKFEPVNYVMGETVYLLLTFKNMEGYSLDYIEYEMRWCEPSPEDPIYQEGSYLSGESSIHKRSENEYYCSIDCLYWGNWYQYTNIYLRSFRYSSESGTQNETIIFVDDKYSTSIYVNRDSDVHYISTVEDLKNMETQSGYFELTNDIDLSGIEWKGVTLNGVFNGNGHSIKNLTYVGKYAAEGEGGIGLFSTATGVIMNLHMENVLIIAEATTGYSTGCGGIVGYSTGVIMENCTVDSNSIIEVTNFGSAGGLSGNCGYNVVMINCVDNAQITSKYK